MKSESGSEVEQFFGRYLNCIAVFFVDKTMIKTFLQNETFSFALKGV